MKTKLFLSVGILAAVFALNLCAYASEQPDEVVFRGNVFCLGLEDCQNFANWGPTAADSYVVLYEADGVTVSDYLWIDSTGRMTFESDNESGGFAELPPPGFVFLGGLIEDGTLQEVDQFFPGSVGSNRRLFIQSDVVEGTTPEPSTLLLFGPAAVFLFGRARRFWRS
jgi:hypothetical protein